MRTTLRWSLGFAALLSACTDRAAQNCDEPPDVYELCGSDSEFVGKGECTDGAGLCGEAEYCGKTYYCAPACGFIGGCSEDNWEGVSEAECAEAGDLCVTKDWGRCGIQRCLVEPDGGDEDAGDDAG